MNREDLITLYDRFARLVEKLPGGLQKPILRELTPIRNLFLEQRSARLILLGGTPQSVPETLHRLFGITVETGESDHGWRSYHVPDRGTIQILDARGDTPTAVVEGAIAFITPDAALFLKDQDDSVSGLESAAERIDLCPKDIPLVGVALGGDSARARLSALMSADRSFFARQVAVCSPEAGDSVAETVCALLPSPAKLEFARITAAKAAQAQIAGSLLKSFTAVCGVIGLQPIPLADMPVLTALQTLMVGLIIHTTGRPVSPRLIAEFLGALGINIGAGMVFRESARAIIKVVPFWGNAVSGMVAGAGTYALGRAAIAYFIEESPITETKKLFQTLLPGWDAFKRRRLPKLSRKKLPPKS